MRATLLPLALSLVGCGTSDVPSTIECSSSALGPPFRVVKEMVAIPGGSFRGTNYQCEPGTLTFTYGVIGDAQGQSVTLREVPFAIDKSLVRCDELKRCIDAGACTGNLRARFSCVEDIAITQVDTAMQFCAWREMRLPSWRQWQRAIRGRHGLKYPRGMEWDDGYRHDPHIPHVGHPYTSPDGVEYFVRNQEQASISFELTRDEDCDSFPPHQIGQVLATPHVHELDWTYIDKHTHQDASSFASFRCVREYRKPVP
jgi:hypothetical protein